MSALPDGSHLLVVPHTHWDREWYRTHEQFRYRLVSLLDGLLELLERDSAYRHFTLDGQLIVLDDYFEVRPQARERVAALVRAGRLLVGPWYVLPDEWLVSGEALVRNLRLGLAKAAALGGAMPLGYVPDQFGHVGQLPQIFAGFGFEGAVLWRGVGDDVGETLFTWEAPDGTRVPTAYLIHGYGNASELPLEPDALARRLSREAASLARRSRGRTLLLMNGSDHVFPQPELPRALEAARAQLDGASVEIGTLPAFLRRAVEESPGPPPLHRGELRSGLRAPLLVGCASARAHQKRADFRNDRLLTRYLEPLAAWLQALGGDADPQLIELAWRIALENHPHDSICGCSIDRVHEQMDVRFARVEDLAGAHLRRVTAQLADRVRAPSRRPRRDLGAALVWNPHAGGAALAEGTLELDVPGSAPGRALPLHLRDAGGRALPAHAVLESPGREVARYRLPAHAAAELVAGLPSEFAGSFLHGLRTRRRAGRLAIEALLGSEPPRGFDAAEARARARAALERAGEVEAEFRICTLPRVRLRFCDALPGCGLRAYRVVRGPAPAGPGAPRAWRTPDGGAAVENGAWRVEARPDGRVDCTFLPDGSVVRDAVRLVCEGDRGDEYNFDPVPGDEPVERPETVRVRLGPASDAEAGVEIDALYRVPRELAPDRSRRARRRVGLRARLSLRLSAGLDRVDLELAVGNTARDHRLRALLRAPFTASRFEVESAFEIAARPIAPQPDDFGGGRRPAERPIGTTPQRSFATLGGAGRGFTVANRGCAEVEALPEADGSTCLAVTVLRAVGWLSRDDLTLRPGHAGPWLETPGAQVPGEHRAELSWRLHGADDPTRVAEAHRFAAPPLLFPGPDAGEALEVPEPARALADGARLLESDDPQVVVSAVEPGPDGGARVRVYNASSAGRRLSLRWNAPRAVSLQPVDLAGRPDPARPGSGGAETTRELRPWEIACYRVVPRG